MLIKFSEIFSQLRFLEWRVGVFFDFKIYGFGSPNIIDRNLNKQGKSKKNVQIEMFSNDENEISHYKKISI